MPPLYKIKRGREILYAYTESEKEKLLPKGSVIAEEPVSESEEEFSPTGEEGEEQAEETKETGKKGAAKVSVQRFKGLGEMNPEELWETTMDPQTRLIKKVDIEDAQEADRVFDVLMGTDVASRKSFIQSRAKEARLDI